jgi:hypothetical protein
MIAINPSEGSGDRKPSIPPDSHPIISKRYVIVTPQIEALCAEAVNLVHNRTPGGLFWAAPRTGKSSGIDMVEVEFQTVFPGMPVMTLPAWDYTVPKEGAFMQDLLKAVGHALVKKGSPEEKRDRLVELMAQLAVDAGNGRIVLIIDEAQQLHEKHYKWLMGIHNLLAKRAVHLITLLVGQHELVHQRSAFLRAAKENIVGRFMVQMFQFHGIQNAEEMAESLSAYDIEEYPENSGWSYTRYFVPELFAEGWRAKNLADLLWGCFFEARKLAPPKKAPKEIQMQYFCRTVEYVLVNLHKIGVQDDEALRKLATTAIAASGYLDVLLL